MSDLQILLWTGVIVLVLFFGLILLLTVLRVVRRRYFKANQAAGPVAESPWRAAGQRAAPIAGGEAVEGETPDDDPDALQRRRHREQFEDPNDDTGPLPGEEDQSDEDDDDDEDWKRV